MNCKIIPYIKSVLTDHTTGALLTMITEKSINQRFSYSSLRLEVLVTIILCCCIWLTSPDSATAKSSSYEIMVHAGEVEKTVEYFKSKEFWGKSSRDKDLDVPRIILAVTSKRWQKESQKIPVAVKKELFYRAIVPMVLLANELIMEDRKELVAISETLNKGKTLNAERQSQLQALALKYGLQDVAPLKKQVTALLERVDVIPPSLALGQTAYESGYGTSRFAVEGNALFGQWTFSGDGMKPKEHRASKGNYGVAAYDWPFDSVRSYMQNLNTHSAYQKLRDKRLSLRKQGKDVTGVALAETLDKYSERGMEYVKTLKSIINVNGLAITDKAYLRDEPTTLIVGVGDVDKVEETETKIEELRASGELDRIIKSMRLNGEK
jgi:Bax protein